MKQYTAKARGYDGVKVREVGEKFYFAGPAGKWMKLVDDVIPADANPEQTSEPVEKEKVKKRKNDQVIG